MQAYRIKFCIWAKIRIFITLSTDLSRKTSQQANRPNRPNRPQPASTNPTGPTGHSRTQPRPRSLTDKTMDSGSIDRRSIRLGGTHQPRSAISLWDLDHNPRLFTPGLQLSWRTWLIRMLILMMKL